jgi:hypothetical protein
MNFLQCVMLGKRMKKAPLISLLPLAAVLLAASSFAQSQIYRCGNEYTNDASDAKARGCKPFAGGNITIVPGTRPSTAGAPARAGAASQPRVGAADQRARDVDARAILESELSKAQARQTELLVQYNNGEPEMLGPEHRNHQKYLDRIAEMKASIDRNQSDIAGIQRELARLPASQ